ncbi:MAG TPA: molecular chaperone HtpG [Gammaproteobacteria bacterium]|nr:molecular chaperone HtpG [Gammaproteobacteria bacterium]
MENGGPSTFAFQAEVKQLLHLMVHSLYSEREIFLRELISNASDANDRLRFESLARPELNSADPELRVLVTVDPQRRVLSVTDNGIGMSREEVIDNLGTIARSGTGQFLERLTGDQRKDAQLIGQFGVGFYSAFIVADEVTVVSRRADAPPGQGVRWVSDGRGEYSVETVERLPRGTTVELKLKDNAGEFLEPERLKALIRKYSDHIAFPVRLVGADEQEETVNRAKALWARPRAEIKDEEYVEFYKHIAHDTEEPLIWSHNRVEGKREYTSLLYVPATAPFDLWNREAPRGVKLYVQRVFITDQATQFLPLYLRFVRGVVDSSELALNVSRELLQQDEAIGAMRTALTRRVLDMLDRLAEDADKYAKFWGQFGALLKEGLIEDVANRDRLAKLMRFSTTKTAGDEQTRGLSQYLADAKADQDAIYFLVAESPTAARNSPHLEAFKERGIEVLLLTDRLDEWVMQHLTEHGGKPCKDVRRGVLDLEPAKDAAPKVEAQDRERQALLKRVKQVLRERVDEVRVGGRLRQSAACLVLNEHDLGYQMRELLSAAGHKAPAAIPSLELNPEHALVRRLDAESDPGRFERLALLLFEQAVLAEGRQLDDPAAFVARLNELLTDLGARDGAR